VFLRLVEIWLPYGRSEIPARVAEEKLVDILKPESGSSLGEPVAEAEKLLQTNGEFQDATAKASRPIIVLGSCGSQQLTTVLTQAVLKALIHAQGSARILCTQDAIELDSGVLGDVTILKHTNKSTSTPLTDFHGTFTPNIDSEFVNSDLRILIGELRPHHFLEYSGLCDLVFPNLATDASLHCHLADRPGITLSDLHKERVEIAKSFQNLFALGLTLNAEMRPSTMVFGDIHDSLTTLNASVKELYSRPITKRADIVVIGVGGSPFDESLLEAIESLPAGLNALKKEGTLILAAECGKGHGDTEFYDWSSEHKEPRYLETRLRHKFNYNGFKASFLSRTLESHRICLVSTIPDYYVENVFRMKSATTVNAALHNAQRTQGSDSTITVIPNAGRVIPVQIEAAKQ
jgi:nickel-dependent lactate racemase